MGFTTSNNRTTDTPPYAYDASGNLTQNHQYTTTNSFTYNPENFNVSAPNSTYVVDAIGRRVKKIVSGTTTDVFYIGSEIIAEKSGDTWTDYVFVGGQRIAQQVKVGSNPATVHYLHTDHRRCGSLLSGRSSRLLDVPYLGYLLNLPRAACKAATGK